MGRVQNKWQCRHTGGARQSGCPCDRVDRVDVIGEFGCIERGPRLPSALDELPPQASVGKKQLPNPVAPITVDTPVAGLMVARLPVNESNAYDKSPVLHKPVASFANLPFRR